MLKRLAFTLLPGLNSFDAACGRQARQVTVATCVTAKTIKAAPRALSIHHSLPGPARPQQNQKRPRCRSRYMNLGATLAGLLAAGGTTWHPGGRLESC